MFSYRRRLKKERLEKEKSNINELAEKDPEKFEEKMKMVDKSRVKVRLLADFLKKFFLQTQKVSSSWQCNLFY